ncbi:CCKAR [Mytilus coruscus]|uniref:CCKAR n=1 Tax=Mytilus coruscus TaxID=42192 RepID=A0A6J8A2Q3_MYTCO|nr:CCKAR [Mytilus coruscus]
MCSLTNGSGSIPENSEAEKLNMTERIVEDWIKLVERNIIPDMALLFLYIIVGIVGNSIVLLVYKYEMKVTSDERYFIPKLAIADMFASVVCSVAAIIWDIMQIKFSHNILCKLTFCCLTIPASLSLWLLQCIAVQRYFKICRDHTLSLKVRRIMVVSICIISVILCFPYLVLYGSNEFLKDGVKYGSRCGRLKDYDYYEAGFVYAILFGVLMILTVVALTFLYGKVGLKIFHHFRSDKCKSTKPPKSTTTNSGSEENTNTTIADKNVVSDSQVNIDIESTENENNPGTMGKAENTSDVNYRKGNPTEMNSTNQHEKTSNVCTDSSSGQKGGVIVSKEVKEDPFEKRNRRVKRNFSIMFIVITSVSLLCYFPVGSIVVLEGIFPTLWEGLNPTELAIVIPFYHLFIVNSIVNPFVYAFLDAEFNAALVRLFKR